MTSPIGNRRGGFTLVELTIAIFIMATLLAIAAPSFVRSFNSAQLSAAGRSLATMCQLARLQAALQQRPAELHVSLDEQDFWVSQRHATEDGDQREVVIRRLEVPDRVTMVSAQLPDEPARKDGEVTIRFYPNGTCDALTVMLQGRERGEAVAVMIDPVTARAEVQVIKG